jgi:undecaprenyl-diphosphatase
MQWWTAVFLGLIQGIAEFLPISSSGHLILAEHLFNIESTGLLFNIVLHIATLLAVCAVYYKKIWELIKKPFCKYNLMLLSATIITCAFVLFFKDLIDKTFTILFLPFAFITTAAVLLLPAVIKPKQNTQITFISAVTMGFAQGLAVIPGFSRSGFTITAGQLSQTDKTNSADFSFLMSVPIIIASLLYEVLSQNGTVSINIGTIIIAFISAFVSGFIAIKFMLSLIQKYDIRWFSLYLFVLGLLLLLFL